MKIGATNLRGVGKWKSLDISQNTCFVGKNGTGKSTMLNIPYYVLTGKGLSQRNGTTESEAAFTLGNDTISRRKTPSGTTIRFNGSVVTGPALEKELALRKKDKDVLAALFEPYTHLDNNFLLRMANFQLTPDTIGNYVDFSKAPNAETIMADYFKKNGKSSIDIPALEQAEKWFTGMRRQAKREIARLKPIAAPILAAGAPKDFDRALQEIDAKIKKTKADLDGVEQIISDVVSKNAERKALQKTIADMEVHGTAEELKEKIAQQTLNVEHNAQEQAQLLAKIEKQKQEADALKKELDEKEKECTAFLNKHTVESKELASCQKTLDVLQNAHVCPLYAGIECTADKSGAIQTLSEKQKSLTEALREYEQKMNEIDKEIHALRDRVDDMTAERDKLEDQYEKAQRAGFELAKVSGSLEQQQESVKRIESLKARLAQMQDLDDKEEVERGLKAKLTTLLMEQTVEKTSLEAEKAQESENAKVLAALTAAQEERHNYDFIVKAAHELPQIIFTMLVKPLQQSTDAILADLKPEWSFHFDGNANELSITVVTPSGEFPLEELSSGERVLANYVLKVVLCQLVGCDTLFLDEVEVLDEAHQKALADIIRKSNVNTVCVFPGEIPEAFKDFQVISF